MSRILGFEIADPKLLRVALKLEHVRNWPPDNVFTPKQVAHIVEKLGIPFSLFED
ncbi:hypothetical protein [Runella limosa]|uniref:hypothetical protein n=1 Tax=Runella limosa TaxID=370978 RepID=UPI0003FAF086|nr:hypothetical protein [Runella limosa]